MVLQTGQQIIAIHILPSIPRSKDRQTMKPGHFIKHNVRKIFLQNRLLHLDETKEIAVAFNETGEKVNINYYTGI